MTQYEHFKRFHDISQADLRKDHIGFGLSDKPALFIWGMKDPIIKPAYLQKFLTHPLT